MTMHGAERQRQRDVAPRVLHLAGGERDVVPGVGGEQRSGLRHADRDEQAERGQRRRARARCRRRRAAPRGCRSCRRPPAGFQPSSSADDDQPEQRAGLGGREDVLDDLCRTRGRACWSTSAARSARCRPAAPSTATARSRCSGASAAIEVVVVGDPRHQHAEDSARSRPRRRRWCRSGSRGTASSRRESPTAARTPRAGRRTGRRRAASSPPARRRTARRRRSAAPVRTQATEQPAGAADRAAPCRPRR